MWMHIKTFKQLSIYKRRHYPFSFKEILCFFTMQTYIFFRFIFYSNFLFKSIYIRKNLTILHRVRISYRLLFESMYKYLTTMKILSMLGTGYFLEIAKINFQQEKPICPHRKNQFPQNTKNGQSAKINFRKNFMPHGIFNNYSSSRNGF